MTRSAVLPMNRRFSPLRDTAPMTTTPAPSSSATAGISRLALPERR